MCPSDDGSGIPDRWRANSPAAICVCLWTYRSFERHILCHTIQSKLKTVHRISPRRLHAVVPCDRRSDAVCRYRWRLRRKNCRRLGSDNLLNAGRFWGAIRFAMIRLRPAAVELRFGRGTGEGCCRSSGSFKQSGAIGRQFADAIVR